MEDKILKLFQLGEIADAYNVLAIGDEKGKWIKRVKLIEEMLEQAWMELENANTDWNAESAGTI